MSLPRAGAVLLLLGLLVPAGAGRVEAESSLSLKARDAYEAGETARAIELLERERKRHPRDPDLLARLAMARFRQGERDEALAGAEASSALEAEPSRAWAQRVAAGLASPTPEEALLPLLELARLEPRDCSALSLAARLEQDAGRAWPAAALTERALERCPMRLALLVEVAAARLEQGCPSAALDLINRALRLHPEPPLLARLEALTTQAEHSVETRFHIAEQGLFNAARALGAREGAGDERPRAGGTRDEDRLHTAITLPSRMAEDEGVDAEVEVRMAEGYRVGQVAGFEGSLKPARAHAWAALARRGPWSRALVLLGTLELADQPPQAEEAERDFLAALSADPVPEPLAWAGLFFAHVARDRYAAAVLAADLYLDSKPDDDELRTLRNEVLARLAP